MTCAEQAHQIAAAERDRIRRFAAALDSGSDETVMTLVRELMESGAAAERDRIVALIEAEESELRTGAEDAAADVLSNIADLITGRSTAPTPLETDGTWLGS